MFELIDEIEEGLKRFLTKKGLGWLFFFVAIGFTIGKGILTIIIKNESKKNMPKAKVKVETREWENEKANVNLNVTDEDLPTQTVKTYKKKTPFVLSSILKNRNFAWFILLVSFLLMLIENFLKIEMLVGGWHIVLYVVILFPLLYLLGKNEVENPYTRLFLPFLFVFIIDMFYYNNSFVQHVLPIVFFVVVTMLYLTSMHKVHALYQTLLPTFKASFEETLFMGKYFENLWTLNVDKQVFQRIFLALAITLPFLAVFLLLFLSADSTFSDSFKNLLDFNLHFDYNYLLTIPLYFLLFLFLFLYSFSNQDTRLEVKGSKAFDLLIVNIFLVMINVLFFSFIALQIPFLLNDQNIPEGITIAKFAREGFFQLMMVMGIVLGIFIFIMRRFKGEKSITFLLSGLLIATIVMGVVSVKKMYLYQTLKGATILRYYVEWFDYLLIFILALGIVFLVKKIKFEKLLSSIVVLGMGSFTLIVSLNIDAMVTTYNLEKFKDQSELLDIKALERLSIDALPVTLENNVTYTNENWFIDVKREGCKDFGHYHFGYCSKLKLIEDKK